MEITAAVAAASQAITIARAIRDAEKAYDRATLRNQMAEMADKLADLRDALREAHNEVRGRDEEIDRLKAAFTERAELVVGEGDYKFRADAQGNPSGYPMCPACEVRDGRMVQLKRHGLFHQTKCPACEGEFGPVACYVPGDQGKTETLADQLARKRDAQSRRDSAALAGIDGSWMV